MVQITSATFACLLLLVPVLAAPIRNDGELLSRESLRLPRPDLRSRDIEEVAFDIEAREPKFRPVNPPQPPAHPRDIEAREAKVRPFNPITSPRPPPRPRDIEEDAFDIEAREPKFRLVNPISSPRPPPPPPPALVPSKGHRGRRF